MDRSLFGDQFPAYSSEQGRFSLEVDIRIKPLSDESNLGQQNT